jgi:hypothetical protein
MGEACSTYKGSKGVYRVLVGKPVVMTPLGRPRRSWEDNIKMDLKEMGFWGMDWIDLAQDTERWQAIVNAVKNLQVHKMRGIS